MQTVVERLMIYRENGMPVAVHQEQTEERPETARITSVEGDNVHLAWLEGSWNGTWPSFLTQENVVLLEYPLVLNF